MTRPIYDGRITLGNIITIASMLLGAAVAYANMTAERSVLNQRMSAIEKRLDTRDGDHDRLVQIEADVRYIRTVIDKRAQAAQ